MYQVLYLPLPGASEMTTLNPEMADQMVEAVLLETAEKMIFLMNLTESTHYAIFVRGLNTNGAGPYAEKVTAVTLVEFRSSTNEVPLSVSSGPPGDLIAVGMVAGIAMAWDDGSTDQGLIIYEISYQTRQGQNAFGRVNRTDRFIFLTNLEEAVVYDISIQAYDGDELGPYNEITIATTLKDDIPVNSSIEIPSGVPSNVVVKSLTITTLSLAWDEVNISSSSQPNNSEAVVYEVHYRAFIEGSVLHTVQTVNRSVKLSGLLESTTYVFLVRVLSLDVAGPFSEAGFVKTLEDSKLMLCACYHHTCVACFMQRRKK